MKFHTNITGPIKYNTIVPNGMKKIPVTLPMNTCLTMENFHIPVVLQKGKLYCILIGVIHFFSFASGHPIGMVTGARKAHKNGDNITMLIVCALIHTKFAMGRNTIDKNPIGTKKL